MRPVIGFGLVLAALAAPAATQDAHKAQAVAGQASATSPAKKLEALVQRYNKEREDVFAAYQKATTDEERAKILTGMPGPGYVPEFRALAEEARGTDAAAQAWIWVMRLSAEDKASAWQAVTTLLEEHMPSAVIAELTGELRYASYQHGEAPVIEALRAIVDESPHEKVRAGALFTLGAVLLESKDANHRTEGRNCFEAVITEYGDQPYRGDSTYRKAAEGFLYELDHLQVGMVAPEFESVDENGVPWKLSDYRGKVVIVDFWGFW
jgi:hypothetical protein